MTEHEKKLKEISDIHRAMGIIDGLACGIPEGAAMMASCATEMIEEALEVLIHEEDSVRKRRDRSCT